MNDTWVEHTSAFDRVKDVALMLSEPRTAAWIAEEATVSENTARNHLGRLADLGVLSTTSTPEGTGYYPDPIYTRSQDLRELVQSHSEENLAERAVELQAELNDFQEEFGVESPTALRASAAEDDIDADTARNRLSAASDWEYARFRLSLIRDALKHYDTYTTPKRSVV